MIRKAFTLIELLVVIAVIAVLMGILMPALNRARDMGRRAACMSNMRVVGIGLHMYTQDNLKLPPKRHPVNDFHHPDAPPNVLKLLSPLVRSSEEAMSPKIYNCPSLKRHPLETFAPTEYSSTTYSANTVPLGRALTQIPRAGTIIVLQEAWSRTHRVWNQPEPNIRTEAVLSGRQPTTYQEWHMWANSGVDQSFLSQEMRENLSNVHFAGGNLVFADGHAEYRKYVDLRSGHFGLTPDEPYEPTRDQSGRDYDAAF